MTIDVLALDDESRSAEKAARLRVRESENELFKVYLGDLYKFYDSGSSSTREMLVSKVKRVCFFANSDSTNVTFENPNAKFDPAKARATREDLGLTRRQLCEEFFGLHEMTVYKYETGILKVSTRGQVSISYLLWLKNNGYDPFKISVKPAFG